MNYSCVNKSLGLTTESVGISIFSQQVKKEVKRQADIEMMLSPYKPSVLLCGATPNSGKPDQTPQNGSFF